MRVCGLILFIITSLSSVGQVVYHDLFRKSVYEFIDELAAVHVIDINSVVAPYSREEIANWLNEAKKGRDNLNLRQQKELSFFLKDFGKEQNLNKDFKRRKDLFYYRDSLFAFTINPIIGFNYQRNSSGKTFHRWNGGEAWAYFGKSIGAYFSLRDNGVSDILAEYNFLTTMQGANYKVGQKNGRSDFSEAKGGVTYSWKWGTVGVLKDNFTWGNQYHGANIFSARNPSFAHLNLRLKPTKWFDFRYIHGWLVSEVLDSTRTYGTGSSKRFIMREKFLAANLLTVTPFQKLNISFGNSVIYSDTKINPVYLIPFMFFKSADHTYNGTGSNKLGQNAQMFLDISFRRIKNFHFYSTIFVDEVSLSNMWDAEKHTNLMSFKFGGRASNLVPNVVLTAEYTRTNPWTYQHQIETSTYASNQFTLGHYLLDNADEVYLAVGFKPLSRLKVNLNYTHARKGEEVDYEIINGVPNVLGLKWMEREVWGNRSFGIDVSYELINDGVVFVGLKHGNISGIREYSPEFLYGKQTTFSFGVNFGL